MEKSRWSTLGNRPVWSKLIEWPCEGRSLEAQLPGEVSSGAWKEILLAPNQ